MNKISTACLLIFLSGLFIFDNPAFAQTVSLTLEEVVRLAKEQSTSSLRAATNKERSYWEYRVFRSNYNPQLVFSGTLPSFNRSFSSIQQEDGSYRVNRVNRDISAVGLGIRQSIGLTGGELRLGSDVERSQNFIIDNIEYGVNPITIDLIQPLFSFNPLLWDRKIEPLRYIESEKVYMESLENISIQATRLFFDLMLAQVDMEIAQINLANNDTIYKIAQGRYNLGNIAENELLQLELNLMNSRQGIAQARLDLESSRLRLRSYIGFRDVQAIELLLPDNIPLFTVNEELALSEAHKNRADAIAFKRRNLEAQRDLARAKKQTGFEANLYGSFGISSRANELSEIYSGRQDPLTRLRIGFSIPVIDWGRAQSRIKTAEANQQLIEYAVEQDEINFNEEILTQVRLFNMLRSKIEISAKTAEIGQRSYDISKNRFMIGRISITDMNDALQKKDDAHRRHIQSLREFWQAYYNLRMLTLYDFHRGGQLLGETVDGQ
jgi:outer membrane protein